MTFKKAFYWVCFTVTRPLMALLRLQDGVREQCNESIKMMMDMLKSVGEEEKRRTEKIQP